MVEGDGVEAEGVAGVVVGAVADTVAVNVEPTMIMEEEEVGAFKELGPTHPPWSTHASEIPTTILDKIITIFPVFFLYDLLDNKQKGICQYIPFRTRSFCVCASVRIIAYRVALLSLQPGLHNRALQPGRKLPSTAPR